MRTFFSIPAGGRTVLAMVAYALMLSGCQNSGGFGSLSDPDAGKPISLAPPSNRADPGTPGATQQQVSIQMPVDRALLQKAIERYRINKGIAAAGATKIVGADLDSNGLADALVLFTGEDWCTRTGCTLAVFKPGKRGFSAVSTIRRVKAPVVAAPGGNNGWRDLIVRTGLPGAEQTVALRFGPRGYPGNATTLAPFPSELAVEGEVLLAPDGPGPATVAGQTVRPVAASPGLSLRAKP